MQKQQRNTDPITYEILRHRLQTMTEEAAVTMKRVSGSPVASEIGDLNVAIMDRFGACVVLGQYSISKGSTLSNVVKDVLEWYSDDPGIAPGDGYICNDPYVGVMHQNDVALVMPVFAENELIAWVGAEIHQIDVGGPVPGQVQLGAKDIYGEAPLMPSVCIVRDGRILPDVERNYLRKSRTGSLVALDLRAKIAACNSLIRNVELLIEELGSGGVVGFFEDILDDAERLLRAKLSRMRDGVWHTRGYMEFEERTYRVQVALSKTGDTMTFDFTGTDEQAPATVNITWPCLSANLAGTIVSSLCWDIPWTTGAVLRVFDVLAGEGCLVRPRYPAGVSKSTTSIGLLLGSMVRLAISKMLLASGEFADHAMSGWPGAKAQEELQGVNQFGREFGADILDGMAGGGGARTYQDGVDTGGLAGSPKISISNVEQYELEYPVLYLYRRQLADSGGAGMYRGGNGIDRMYVVHGSEVIPDVVMHCIGARLPATSGLSGGHPSATNQFYVKRQTAVESTLTDGRLPVDFDAIDGAEERHGPMSHTRLLRTDVYRSISNGGGGYGDPLDRAPELVAQDVRTGRVSPETARSIYGVIIGANDAFDPDGTARERHSIRSTREACATPPRKTLDQPESTELVARINSGLLAVRDHAGDHYYACSCGQVISPFDQDIDDYVAVQTLEPHEAGVHIRPIPSTDEVFVLHVRLCPCCDRQLSMDVVRSGDPPLPPDLLVPGLVSNTPAKEAVV